VSGAAIEQAPDGTRYLAISVESGEDGQRLQLPPALLDRHPLHIATSGRFKPL